jgi:hypothetical protein
MYENGKMRPVKTILKVGGGKIINSTTVYCKHFCKCHNVPIVQQ